MAKRPKMTRRRRMADLIFVALQTRSMYEGTVPDAEKVRRRKAGKAARAARRKQRASA